MASTSWNSSVLIWTSRRQAATPSRNTTGSRTSGSVVVSLPKPVASATNATAMIEADNTVRKTVARLWASFQINDLAESKLQCSAASSAGACAPNSLSPATSAARVAAPSAVSGSTDGDRALPGSWSAVSIMDLLGVPTAPPAPGGSSAQNDAVNRPGFGGGSDP